MTNHNTRDDHLFGPGPKRILALDGGGVRGAITVAFLERLEELLAAKAGRPVPLCDVFDLIGGTSTGAIIAAGLSLGFSAREMREFYLRLAPQIFRRPFWRIIGLQSKFDARHLQYELDRIIGGRALGDLEIRTGLCIVTKRMDTGSPWILSNNPRSQFWETPHDNSYIGNQHYRLANIIRASAAAPHYFDPEAIQIARSEAPGLFVDGGVTPYNNPSLYLVLLASLPQHRINWPLGVQNLTVVSVGTGSFRERLALREARRIRSLGLAVKALTGLIADSQTQTLGLMQALGQTETPWIINSEVGTMAGLPLPGGPLFRYLRYDLKLEARWLRDELDLDLAPTIVTRLTKMDDPSNIQLAYQIARAAADKQVLPDHVVPLVETPVAPHTPAVLPHPPKQEANASGGKPPVGVSAEAEA